MDELALAVERNAADGVVLSVAAGYRGDLQAQLDELAARLLPGVAVAVGGEGASSVQNESVLNRFEDLFTWAQRLGTAAPARRR
jgi:hypothetical protein